MQLWDRFYQSSDKASNSLFATLLIAHPQQGKLCRQSLDTVDHAAPVNH